MSAVLYFSNVMIPMVLVGFVLAGAVRRVQLFDAFCEGARDGLKVVAEVFPSLVALFVAVAVLRASSFMDILVFLISPIAYFTGFPAEAVPVALMRLFSGSAAMSMAADIFKTLGPDSFTGRVVSVMMGCTETVFYTLSVYAAGCGVRDTGYALKGAIVANVAGIVASFLVCKMVWG